MKKFIIVVISAIIIMLTATVANAEIAGFCLSGSNNRLSGPKDVKELKAFASAPIDSSISTAIGGIGNYGSVLRNKAMVKNEADCLSQISVSLYAADEEILSGMGIEVDATSIVEATLVHEGNAIGHRFSTKGNVVAQIDIDGQLLNVVATDWDADGADELAFIPGTKSTMGYKMGSSNASSDNGGSESNSSNDAGNSGSSSSGAPASAPDPHYRNF